MSRKSNFYTQVPVANVKRNLFDLSHEVKMSGKFGYLYPVLLMDCLPGDVIRDQMTALVRFAPMLAPVMHRIDVKTDFFFVPARLLSDSWEDFITGGQDGESEPVLSYTTPAAVAGAIGFNYMEKGSLWDYFGLPIKSGAAPGVWSTEQISMLPFKAHLKIWNDYFRDPNLDGEIDIYAEEDGLVNDPTKLTNFLTLRNRGWERDYFTACLPFAQRGPSVLMPLEGVGDVTYMPASYVKVNDGSWPAAGAMTAGVDPGAPPSGNLFTQGALQSRIENIDQIILENSSTTINDFRRALAIQKWMENNALGGARYNEQIFAHFKTRVPDFRLQRAEYLGGGRVPVTVSEVVSTAQTINSGDQETVPVGDLAGHGISVGKSNRFTYHCQEHGYVIGIMSVVPKTAYMQGLDRMWTKNNRFDLAWPELAHLGEQEVLSKEVFFSLDNADNAANNELFGYMPRYAEYKFKNDRVSGDFRDTLKYWHLGRYFVARPTLETGFLKMEENGGTFDEDYRRIFAVQDGTDYLWMQLFHRLTAKRPLPYFGVPMLNG